MAAIDIAAMPVSEKLKLMEALWDSLGAQSDGNMASPRGMVKCLKSVCADSPAGKNPCRPGRKPRNVSAHRARLTNADQDRPLGGNRSAGRVRVLRAVAGGHR